MYKKTDYDFDLTESREVDKIKHNLAYLGLYLSQVKPEYNVGYFNSMCVIDLC